MTFLKLYWGTLRRVGLSLWLLTAVYNSLDQFIAQEMESGLKSPDGVSSFVWFYGIFSLFVGIFFPVVLTIVALFGLSRQCGSQRSWGAFVSKNGNQLAIETLRSWGKILMSGLCFVIPGAYRLLMYAFVPFVVSFSKRYELGQIDALEFSTQLIKKHWAKVLLTIFGFHILIPLSLSSLTDEYKVLWVTPFESLGISLLDALIWILATQILYQIASRLMKEVPDEFVF
jgi:hypothetical protein